jgi:hypothetical protein
MHLPPSSPPPSRLKMQQLHEMMLN